MNGKLKYWFQGNILYFKTEGDYSAGELIELINTALNDPALPKRFAILFDARLSTISRKVEEIKPISNVLHKWKDHIVCSAVVVSDDLSYGVTRQISVYDESHDRETEPFRAIEPALGWLKEKLKSIETDDPLPKKVGNDYQVHG